MEGGYHAHNHDSMPASLKSLVTGELELRHDLATSEVLLKRR
jgi:hypothetical protein